MVILRCVVLTSLLGLPAVAEEEKTSLLQTHQTKVRSSGSLLTGKERTDDCASGKCRPKTTTTTTRPITTTTTRPITTTTTTTTTTCTTTMKASSTTSHRVCIKPVADSFASILLDEDVCVSSIHFTHTSGKVSCRAAESGDSNWGCDADSIGLVITDGSRVTAPVFGTANGFTASYTAHAHWYKMSGVSHNSETMDWVFKEPLLFKAKEYKLWYNEDLTGGTEGDNRGEACYDVVVHESESSCAALAPLQFANVCVSASGDAHGTIDLPQDTCVTGIDVHYLSGSVSCAGSEAHSNFGCGPNLMGLVWTEDTKTEVVMPRQDQVDGMTQTTHEHAHWYTMSGVGKDTRTLPMRLKSGVAPLKVSGKLDLWYNEDLTGGTESDNEGTACYEVAVHRALSC